MIELYPGIYKITLGVPEQHTPISLRKTSVSERDFMTLFENEVLNKPVISQDNIYFETSARGSNVVLPLSDDEQIYGFGLQLKSFAQKGKKKMIRVNADPVGDTGDSHAPIPFYLSTKGYGILVDTTRYVSFYCGSSSIKRPLSHQTSVRNDVNTEHGAKDTTAELYTQKNLQNRSVVIDIPVATGVDIYIFQGNSMKEAIQKYNLFSGGGTLPPLWGLGIWYRTYHSAKDTDVLGFASEFRNKKLPCSVIGLEPGWHTKAYSTSYVWNRSNFPDPDAFIQKLKDMNYNVNLWEHMYVHPTAPFYEEMYPHSGDYEVWEGLVPDFTTDEAVKIFSDYHKKEFADKGISGFKLDECDSSDFTGCWAYPNCAKFPSGLDGEQMHNVMGLLYQDTIKKAYDANNARTWGLARSSHAIASSYPFVIYSDLYGHSDYIRGLSNMGFSGIMWTPEVRSADSVEDLIRRMQSVCFSPLAMINAWPFPNPPWQQINEDLNRQNILRDDIPKIEALCREIMELRMALIPYLYHAFRKYQTEGIPPVRALVLDWPEDNETHNIQDSVIIGDSIFYVPIIARTDVNDFSEGFTDREFYLPVGNWVDFFDRDNVLEGGKRYSFSYEINRFPLFIKEGTILPLAKPVLFADESTVFEIIPTLYGSFESSSGKCYLYEDDGKSFDYLKNIYNDVTITMSQNGKCTLSRQGNYDGEQYKLIQ